MQNLSINGNAAWKERCVFYIVFNRVNPNILILSTSYCWNKLYMKLDDSSKNFHWNFALSTERIFLSVLTKLVYKHFPFTKSITKYMIERKNRYWWNPTIVKLNNGSKALFLKNFVVLLTNLLLIIYHLIFK